jgi:hypothetical protein
LEIQNPALESDLFARSTGAQQARNENNQFLFVLFFASFRAC